MRRSLFCLVAGCLVLLGTACAPPQSEPRIASEIEVFNAKDDIHKLLDEWHFDAARARGEQYFSKFTDDAIFIGTDATEYWTKQDFFEYADPIFSQGRGWRFGVMVRNIYLSEDAKLAWFDEEISSASYQTLRGSGTLIKQDSVWKIAHYNLAFAIPNDIASDVAKSIKEHFDNQAKAGN